jgi:hypothetical protein
VVSCLVRYRDVHLARVTPPHCVSRRACLCVLTCVLILTQHYIYIIFNVSFGRRSVHAPSRDAIYLARTTSEVDTSTSHVVAGSQSLLSGIRPSKAYLLPCLIPTMGTGLGFRGSRGTGRI